MESEEDLKSTMTSIRSRTLGENLEAHREMEDKISGR